MSHMLRTCNPFCNQTSPRPWADRGYPPVLDRGITFHVQHISWLYLQQVWGWTQQASSLPSHRLPPFSWQALSPPPRWAEAPFLYPSGTSWQDPVLCLIYHLYLWNLSSQHPRPQRSRPRQVLAPPHRHLLSEVCPHRSFQGNWRSSAWYPDQGQPPWDR